MSLRLRLLIAAGLVALVALVAAEAITYDSLDSYLNGQVESSIEQARPMIEACLDSGFTPNLRMVEDNAPGMFVEERTPSGAVLGSVQARSVSEGGALLPPPKLPALVPGLTLKAPSRKSAPLIDGDEDCGQLTGLRRKTGGSGSRSGRTSSFGTSVKPPLGPYVYFTAGSAGASGPSYRVRASLLSNGNIMFLASPLSATESTLHRLLLVEAAVTGGALIFASLLGWWLVGISMRPLVEVEETAEAIKEGDLGARVPEPRSASTEIGRLTRVLNSMLGRIEAAFAERDRTEDELMRSEERMRQFLSDASHELRTPLAAVSAYAELFERSQRQHPEDLPRLLEGIRVEADRMGRLVSDLLLLASLDEGRPIEQEVVELVGLASEAIETHRALGPDWPVALRADEAVEAIGDPGRLRQVLDNLLANVRAYTSSGTATELTVRYAEDGTEGVERPFRPRRFERFAELVVSDHGPGLGPEGGQRVFERFFRAEESRSRARGGSGLGLSIVQAIVEAHGGSVTASQTEGGGATFTVRLPAATRDPEDYLDQEAD